MTVTVKEFLPTRQSLLSRLKNWEDHEGWQEFFDTYWKLIYTTALKADLTDAEAQDVVQETIISVSKQMPRFRYNPKLGSFKTWLLKLTRWRIADQFRKRIPEPGPAVEARQDKNDRRTATIDRVIDPNGFSPEVYWNDQWEKTLAEAATERAKAKVDSRQFQIFDLYVNQQWPVSKVASTLKVSRGQIYLAKHRVLRVIRKEMDSLKAKVS